MKRRIKHRYPKTRKRSSDWRIFLTIRHVPNKETNTNQPFHSWVNGTREWNAAVNTAFPVTSSEDETNYKTFSIGSLYIYEDYENTLSCLEKYGYKIKDLSVQKISTLSLYT